MTPDAAFPETIPALLAWRAEHAGNAPWLLFEGDSWTVSDVVDQADRVAVGLAGRGVGRGDRVAVLTGNRPDALFAWFGANIVGAIAAQINPAFKRDEVAGLLRLARPRVLVVADEHRALAEAARGVLSAETRLAMVTVAELAAGGSGAPRAPVQPDDVAVLIATSGTTGAPKAVMQTHRAYTLTAEAFPDWVGAGRSDRLLVALPLFHINAQAYSTMGALGSGAGLSLLPRFSASRFWSEARRLGATHVNAIGAMIHILLKGQAGPGDRDHALRTVYAALALPEDVHRAFEQRFGLSMTVGYGMSETTFGTVWPRGEPHPYGTIGRLRQHPRLGAISRARVVRDDGADANDGEAGELWLASPATTPGYWDDPAQTAAAIVDGWLRTGDLVLRDARGVYTFVARKKEVIRRRGENVAAGEIEGVLLAHPDVAAAAAVARPSDLGDDEIVAYVEPRPGATLDPEALRAWVRERLADFKVPSIVHVREALPRTATERIAKHLLA